MKTKVVIVGGGTAGWLTAGIIAAKHCASPALLATTEVVLVESPDVKNLGVGEGTWPTMRDTLRQIGLSERQFLTCCDASFKQASKFVGWQNGGQDHYYHPFTVPVGYGAVNMAQHWSAANYPDSFESWVCAQGAACDQNLSPKLPQHPEYAFSLNYGYHLNAGKFVELLHQHCVEKLGVTYIQGHVDQVLPANNGDIAAIKLANGMQVAGDLFIDCSGFAALLIGQHYQVPFMSQRHVLFNDTALAIQVEHVDNNAPIASCTVATAQSSGWIWDIALPHRRGIGHVFSRDFCSIDDAEQALQAYITNDPLLSQNKVEPRVIKFDPGHRQTFWQNNCVAIGVSAGFVEPLEATALVLVEKSAEWIAQQLPRDCQSMAVLAKRFNQLTSQRWLEIIDFLKLHYVLTQRSDSDYWHAHQQTQSIPESLQEALTLWRTQPPGLYESNQRFELFSSASKQYVLYGMGFRSDVSREQFGLQSQQAMVKRLLNEKQHNIEKLLNALPTNREFLTRLNQ
ncbi:tryptophan 7-halogenase [Alteromonadaceae bacterium BrNp21-10]|nr:tryptophan 7-halogenase [Alteromonadaceae bacterium BrNp21-10]